MELDTYRAVIRYTLAPFVLFMDSYGPGVKGQWH